MIVCNICWALLKAPQLWVFCCPGMDSPASGYVARQMAECDVVSIEVQPNWVIRIKPRFLVLNAERLSREGLPALEAFVARISGELEQQVLDQSVRCRTRINSELLRLSIHDYLHRCLVGTV